MGGGRGLSVCLSMSVCVKAFLGAREVVQQLKAITTPAEDPGLVSSTHICIFTYRISVAAAGPPQAPTHMWCTYIHLDVYKHVK